MYSIFGVLFHPRPTLRIIVSVTGKPPFSFVFSEDELLLMEMCLTTDEEIVYNLYNNLYMYL